ncbi:hypothetical protein [Kribbella sp. DT2]|uniref:hypothetical protein n=1 Tax=Kribbella sp. DT2 TaxID=3393427 RepID=UPI003CE8C310
MSGTLISRRRSARRATAVKDPELLGALCDRHGAALFTVALAMTDDPVRAEEAVVRVLVEAGELRGAHRSRRELARSVYLYSQRPPQGSSTVSPPEADRQQRAAVCLAHHGDHSLGDLAELLGVSQQAAAALLRAGLRNLA